MPTTSTYLKTVIINITSRLITMIGDDGTIKTIEFDSIDAFCARREFIESHAVGFDIQYTAAVA